MRDVEESCYDKQYEQHLRLNPCQKIALNNVEMKKNQKMRTQSVKLIKQNS